ncbi:MAG: YwaF family protein [Clostridia bacterium]|nr:YwaF family protein [Clostridia bacterium]
MWTMGELLRNFFTHKDFLPAAEQLPGTLFTPLHFLTSACWVAVIVLLCVRLKHQSERVLQRVFAGLWIATVVLEIAKITWETCCGATVSFEWGGILPLYPCSIFMYAMPFAVWGKGRVRYAACGYVCSLGLLGGVINFVYPANVLSNYSCVSFAGFHTLFYHGTLVLCALLMLVSGYHSYTRVTKGYELLLPAVPALCVSVVANLVNFSPVQSDYMFFKLNSFFFAPLGAATPDWLSVMLVYAIYLLIHALPYLPAWLKRKKT